MAPVDVIIVIVLILAVTNGFSHGFFRSVFGLGGLLLGLALAAWNYPRVAAIVLPLVRIDAVADAVGFLLIAVVVTGLASAAGSLVAKTFHQIGLGFLDRLAGGAFGLLQGALLVTLCILVTVAFFPKAHWLVEARLPRMFFGACHVTTHMSPADLAERVREGLKMLEKESPRWMHPHSPAG
jgi:membrane protein required for colicin V production